MQLLIMHSTITILLLLRPGRGAEYCEQFVCLSVHLSVCPQVYLWNRETDLHEICCADPLWPWLGPPLAALRCAVYYGFMDDITFGGNGD